ncbi:ribosomal protein S18 [Jimgerdemannia flammicorona]|uniref:Small ribosomal subunit protein bS18m n=1 Tax=Jimgerdemannia flammicorona TaxID=994334 RepID=A0A433AT24_9FUNG|nr:ribosomal protein S18 [Jimgerdemannia flammicorona]
MASLRLTPGLRQPLFIRSLSNSLPSVRFITSPPPPSPLGTGKEKRSDLFLTSRIAEILETQAKKQETNNESVGTSNTRYQKFFRSGTVWHTFPRLRANSWYGTCSSAFFRLIPSNTHPKTYHPDELNDASHEKRMLAKRGKIVKPTQDPFNTLGLDPLKEYKNHSLLSSFVSDMGKILPREQTGVTAKNQRKLAKAIKRARAMGLMPCTHNPKEPQRYGPNQNYQKRSA